MTTLLHQLIKHKHGLSWVGLIIIVFIAEFVCSVKPAQAAPQLDQWYFRFYVNNDSATPTDPWPAGGTDLAELAAITSSDSPPQQDDILRIRLNIYNFGSIQDLETIKFELQYGEGSNCSAISSWYAIGDVNSTEIWQAYDNPTPVGGTTLDTLLLSTSNVYGSYVEYPSSPVNPNAIDQYQTGEWDWVVTNYLAKKNTNYCFKVVDPGVGDLYSYTYYPQAITRQWIPQSIDWRWYTDMINETPVDNRSNENAMILGVRKGERLRLRHTIGEKNDCKSKAQKFRLQYSTSSLFDYSPFVAERWSCTSTDAWCYADGPTIDEGKINTLLLNNSNTGGRFNEYGTSTSGYIHPAYGNVEYEFTIKNNNATPETVYYFRPYDNSMSLPVTEVNVDYPQAKTFNSILNVTLYGQTIGKVHDGWTTNVGTSALNIDFGNLAVNTSAIAAQKLTITSDGYGYLAQVAAVSRFATADGFEIMGVAGTNDAPAPWSFTPTLETPSAFGYHTTVHLLSGNSTRFQANDTWAAIETTPREIGYSSTTVSGDEINVVYRLIVSPIQPSGDYNFELYYVVTPVF